MTPEALDGFLSDAFFAGAAAVLDGPVGSVRDVAGGGAVWRVGYGGPEGEGVDHVQEFRAGRLVAWRRAEGGGPRPDLVIRRPPAVDHGDFAGTLPAERVLGASRLALPGDPGAGTTDLLGVDHALAHRGLDCAGDRVVACFRLAASPYGTAEVSFVVEGGRCRGWHLGAPAGIDLWVRCPLADFLAWFHGDGLAGPLLRRCELRGGVEAVSYLQGALYRGDGEPRALGRAAVAYARARQASEPQLDAIMDGLAAA